jgi:hypothetical protein
MLRRRAIATRWITLMVLSLIVTWGMAFQPAAAQQASLLGWFAVIWGDWQPGSEAEPFSPEPDVQRNAVGPFVSDGGGQSPLGTVSVAEASSADSPVSFVSIGQGTASGIVDPLEIVIQSEQELQDFWKQHAPSGSPPPPVDFATDLVVGIFAGQRPTSGYQVEIVRVERGGTGIHVIYQIKSPPKDALVAQVLTQPFHLIRLPQLNLPIQFKRLLSREGEKGEICLSQFG